MKTWKKAGITALAGSLVATSAYAGAVTVSGTAGLTYTGNSGGEDYVSGSALDSGTDGSRWGLNKTLTFAGSGELDNGWTVSISQSLAAATTTGIGMTLDMGDMGTLDYQADTSGRGISKINDMIPTAVEDVADGIDVDGSGTSGGLSGKTSGGGQGFHYSKVMNDMVEIGIGYGHKGAAGAAPGGTTGTGGAASSVSGFIKLDPLDGLEIGYGAGEAASATASQTDDHDTMYASYVWGNFTVAVQQSNIDTYGTTADDQSTRWGVLYALNDEMSVSYQDHTNDDNTNSIDEEAHGISASYTSGGITFSLHRNTADNVSNTTTSESEHTEVGVTFAF